MNVPLWAWAAVLAVILAMLAIDLFAHRTAHVVSVREAAIRSAVWVSLGAGVRWGGRGGLRRPGGGEYYAGYLIEKSLAVDNVFVFALMFTYFAVPRKYQHRVLFFGVLGALALPGALQSPAVRTDPRNSPGSCTCSARSWCSTGWKILPPATTIWTPPLVTRPARVTRRVPSPRSTTGRSSG